MNAEATLYSFRFFWNEYPCVLSYILCGESGLSRWKRDLLTIHEIPEAKLSGTFQLSATNYRLRSTDFPPGLPLVAEKRFFLPLLTD